MNPTEAYWNAVNEGLATVESLDEFNRQRMDFELCESAKRGLVVGHLIAVNEVRIADTLHPMPADAE